MSDIYFALFCFGITVFVTTFCLYKALTESDESTKNKPAICHVCKKDVLPEWVDDPKSDDPAEDAFWRFDARRKGYGDWKLRPQSERAAFKNEYRARLSKEVKNDE